MEMGFSEPCPKLEIKTASYTVKLLQSFEEIDESFRLRHEVFHKEHNARSLSSERDQDELDATCDHLGVFYQGRLIGNYRLRNSSKQNTFYSGKRFDLHPLLELPGVKIEAGRACIAADRRQGFVLHLLWRGLSEYVLQTKARFIFGCSSVRTENVDEIYDLFYYLKSLNHVDLRLNIQLQSGWSFGCDEALLKKKITDRESSLKAGLSPKIPHLFNSYLNAGAKIIAKPAHDKYLHCADFLTLLDTHQMHQRYSRRYKLLSRADSGTGF